MDSGFKAAKVLSNEIAAVVALNVLHQGIQTLLVTQQLGGSRRFAAKLFRKPTVQFKLAQIILVVNDSIPLQQRKDGLDSPIVSLPVAQSFAQPVDSERADLLGAVSQQVPCSLIEFSIRIRPADEFHLCRQVRLVVQQYAI